MKFLAAVTLFASAVVAAPNPEPWCYRIGEPCWKVKRTTEAFINAVRSHGGLSTRAEGEAIPNGVALSAIQGLDQLATLILVSSEDPSSFFPPNATEPEGKRDVEVEEDKRWCYRIGEPCWKAKREAEAEAAVEEEKRWCYRIGEPCWKAKRTDEIHESKRWCWILGGKCWKTKRVAEAVLSATIEGDEKRSLETETYAGEKRWCYRIGEPCWKAKRDLETIQDVARSVIESMQ
ncbi:mating pheromone precursor [Trichoderma novae-zelandiae]